jgi:Plavaka transposase
LFKNKRAFYRCIDTLPRGAKWTCEPFEITGDERDENGKLRREVLHLWKRNPVECIRELIGNPAFRDKMQYVPEKVYEDRDGKVRIFDEMWTGDWWWNLQVSILYLPREEMNLPTMAETSARRSNHCSCDHCIGQDPSVQFQWG